MTLPPKRLTLIGPFSQAITMGGLKLCGPLQSQDAPILRDVGLVFNGNKIAQIGPYAELTKNHFVEKEEITEPSVCLPGFIDTHTHICYAGSRERDYALRCEGKSYLEIAKAGGGILDTVQRTRQASLEELVSSLDRRATEHLRRGITTCEVKSGYGLTVPDEIKMLRAIAAANEKQKIDLIPTCLAAHTLPREFSDPIKYLHHIVTELLPKVMEQKLSNRIDIFIEEGAFTKEAALPFVLKAKDMGFSVVVHADQFSLSGSELACQTQALSADHLEAITEKQIKRLVQHHVLATVLPGASLGLGMPFAPARKLLDHGASLVIASDWNPGSAPMGDLLTEAAILGAKEKLNVLETLAGITFRAANALKLKDRGSLTQNNLADMISFPCKDYREILYYQGSLKPNRVWKNGERIL